ncbi:cytochrome b5-like heme/steroid binding domain-containing protein [Paraphoma chrysanthemicola]|uniref:Cytochrome b5-like heme/steroid binding domain-containing protein n=1 Tax=Paraphoma chrysanthemicola TaxID=798071 RepID=A0A8K0VW90_9PLEO|nr:cytochrome b5-like heme/steroid binding domain-containing protein [Paraphoma chrysanthemicola]
MEGITIGVAQLAKHNTQQDLWVAVHGKVYDLTTFATDHPGGIDVLQECAGSDGTETYEYAGHSAEALAVLDRFQIGMLEGHGTSHQFSSPAPVSPLPVGHSAPITEMRRVWSSAHSGSLLVFLSLLAAARIFWKAGYMEAETTASSGQMLRPASAFLVGLVVASSVGFMGLAATYSVFKGTLRQEKEVFAYPSVISVKR